MAFGGTFPPLTRFCHFNPQVLLLKFRFTFIRKVSIADGLMLNCVEVVLRPEPATRLVCVNEPTGFREVNISAILMDAGTDNLDTSCG